MTRQAASPETIAHVWLRFHPREISRLFPPATVFADGATNLAAQIRVIAGAKLTSSWHAGMRTMIPPPKNLTVDVDTKDGVRRFFSVDQEAQTARYSAAFERRNVKPPPAITPELAAEAFDQLWEAFDRDYAMFVLRPELDWVELREQTSDRKPWPASGKTMERCEGRASGDCKQRPQPLPECGFPLGRYMILPAAKIRHLPRSQNAVGDVIKDACDKKTRHRLAG